MVTIMTTKLPTGQEYINDFISKVDPHSGMTQGQIFGVQAAGTGGTPTPVGSTTPPRSVPTPTPGKTSSASSTTNPTGAVTTYATINKKTGEYVPKGTLVDRYGPERTAIENNPAMNVKAPNANRLRDQYRGFAQGTVNAIRSQFDKYIQEDTEAKKQLESRAYLSSLASGQSGSPTGATKTYNAAETGEKKVRQTIAERDSLVEKAYGDADLRSSQEYQRQRAEYLNSASDKYAAEQTLNGNVRTAATNELKTFAQNRTFDEWANQAGPEKIKQYMEETGMDETALKAFFLVNTPKDELVSASGTKLGDGTVVWHKKVFDDNGNLTGVTEVARIAGSAEGKTIKDSRITDEGVQILYTDGTYETKGTGAGGATPTSGGKQIVGAPQGINDAAIEEGRSRLSNIGAYQGYANPYLYMDMYTDWIEKGGDRAAFIKYFPPTQYINPEHNELKNEEKDGPLIPDYLRSTQKKVTASSTTTPITTTTTTASGRSF